MAQSNGDPRTVFEQRFLHVSRAELGGLIKEYIAESNHSGWAGFDSRDLTGIKRFLEDVITYHANAEESNRYDWAVHINNVNPVP